ncbi:MAG: hypothetical protein JSV19_03090 [Phycisphaerales bacterium]|nr:MAG: hypothetical protein JSV19_03090 [Phycisphaerales bacterium]
MMKLRAGIVIVALAVGLLAPQALAVPYASGVTDLGGGDYSFVLNQDAGSVFILRTGDTPLLLGALTKGSHTFNIGSGSAFQIVVSNSEAPGWAQFSDDNDNTSKYYTPRGVAVNQNAASPYFGWIYVAEGYAGTTGSGRTTTDGLYVMSADQADATGQGDAAYDGGVDWVVGGSSSPFRVHVAPDDTVYISDWSDGHSGVWRAAADGLGMFDKMLADETNVNSGAGGLYDNHGSIASVYVEGTGMGTVMYTLDEDWPESLGIGTEGRGDVLRYDIGMDIEHTGPPSIQADDDTPSPEGVILNSRMDVVRDDDGSWWIAQYRWTESPGAPSLTRFLDGGTGPVYNSADDLGLPLLIADYGNLDIHNGFDMIAMGARSGYGVYILDISDPDNLVLSDTIPQSGYAQDVAFDIAGNVYVASSSSETLRIWSPGGDWLAITGSDGTFFPFAVPVVYDLDIKPGSCPNSFNRKSRGVLHTAVCGTETLDATMIDIASVRLSRADGIGGQVAPHEGPPGPHSFFDDVATPYHGESCHELEADGIVDLKMYFQSEVVTPVLELGTLPPGALVELVVSGTLIDGTPFTTAGDWIRLVPPGTPPGLVAVSSTVPDVWIDAYPLDLQLDDGGFADFQRSYPQTSLVTLTAPRMAEGVRFARWEIDGEPQARGQTTIDFEVVGEVMEAKAVFLNPGVQGIQGAPVQPIQVQPIGGMQPAGR